MAALNKQKISLTTQLEDTKRLGDAESRDRSALLTKFKNLSTELENLRERIDDEHQRKSDALKALSKAQAEIQLWRSRYETEGLGRVDELEASRKKLQMLRSLREECSQTSKKSQWNMSALMQLLSLPRNEEETLTRLLENGNQRQMMFLLRLRLAKKNAETSTVSSSG